MALLAKVYAVSNPESYCTFINELEAITQNNNTTMGLEELILQIIREEGIEKSKTEVVRNLILKMGL